MLENYGISVREAIGEWKKGIASVEDSLTMTGGKRLKIAG
jgi:hypothetical protein